MILRTVNMHEERKEWTHASPIKIWSEILQFSGKYCFYIFLQYTHIFKLWIYNKSRGERWELEAYILHVVLTG